MAEGGIDAYLTFMGGKAGRGAASLEDLFLAMVEPGIAAE